jgi:hypothetical protein
MSEEQKDDLIVSEQEDGTATVQGVGMPEDEDSEQEETRELADGGQVDDDEPNDSDEIRKVRKEKRSLKKQFHRQQQQEKDLRYGQLVKQNQELVERLSVVERRTHGSELARIDKALEDQQLRVQYAEMKISEATQHSDGEGMKEAQKMWYDARQRVDALEGIKQRAATTDTPALAQPDQGMKRLASAWVERNPWYDVNHGDEDSEIALIIDKKMAKEGWDPRSVDYWEELDNRLQKRLPHHYESRYNNEEDKSYTKRPKSVVTSSGRESSGTARGTTSFTASKEQVKAMKDAGMWDDPEKRNSMMRRYVKESRQNRS